MTRIDERIGSHTSYKTKPNMQQQVYEAQFKALVDTNNYSFKQLIQQTNQLNN